MKNGIIYASLDYLVYLSSSGRRSFYFFPFHFDLSFFYSLYDQIFRPSKLLVNAEFHCFRAGIEPKWEDPECAEGGKWSLVLNRKSDLESMWLETVSLIFCGAFYYFLFGNFL